MWTDTVMSIPETALVYENGWLEYTRTHKKPSAKADLESYRSSAHDAAWEAQNKAQAEISFKAGGVEESTGGTNSVSYLAGTEHGYAEGYNKCLAQLAGMTEECKQMGRKEVVDWIDDNWGMTPVEKQLWHDQLKVWGK